SNLLWPDDLARVLGNPSRPRARGVDTVTALAWMAWLRCSGTASVFAPSLPVLSVADLVMF
ncbi:hypothetical protein NDU88_003030, partial [Pleurodeles waltl]